MIDIFENNTEVKNRDIRTPGSTLEDFQKGTIWTDIKFELYAWLIDTWEQLENPENDEITTATLRGRARAIREMLELPNMLSSVAYLQEEEEK